VPPRRVVLVVEDDAAVRRMLVALLRGFLVDLDVEVREAGDAAAALRWVEAVHPSVVVTDVMMPGALDGAGLIARLKGDPRTAALPVLAVSGDPAALERAAAAGADAVLPKTARPDAVAARVRAWLTGGVDAAAP
jgi:CheY-like chemotaxis protein